jgi:hypothetical protein
MKVKLGQKPPFAKREKLLQDHRKKCLLVHLANNTKESYIYEAIPICEDGATLLCYKIVKFRSSSPAMNESAQDFKEMR